MSKVLISLIILVGVIIGFGCLQIALSRKENKWFGLILPIVGLFCSIVVCFSFTTFNTMTQTSVQEMNEEGEVIREEVGEAVRENVSITEFIGMVIPLFLITNIPTGVNLCIYAAVREGKKKHSQMNKMNIQDL